MNTSMPAPSPTKPIRHITQPFVIVGCLIERDGKYLFIQEGGKWNMPAGWLEMGETPEAGAIREAGEETGSKVTLEGLIGIYTLIKRRTDKTLHAIKLIFLGHPNGNWVGAHEKHTQQWFTAEDLQNMHGQFWDPDVPKIIADAKSGQLYPLRIQQDYTQDPE